MVDSTKGVGTLSGVAQKNNLPPVKKINDNEETSKTRKADDIEVKKKKKDLSASEAEEASRQTRKELESSSQTLGLGNNFDERV